MDAHIIYLPDPDEIAPFAIAFARMMFAHAAFEREVRDLQAAIVGVYGFGEKRENQWNARARPALMVKLIAKHFGAIPEAEPIRKILTEAIPVCDARNLLAHGEWWLFDRAQSTIHVRGGTQWKDDGAVDHRTWTIAEIVAVTEKFKDLDVQLYNLRLIISQQRFEQQQT